MDLGSIDANEWGAVPPILKEVPCYSQAQVQTFCTVHVELGILGSQSLKRFKNFGWCLCGLTTAQRTPNKIAEKQRAGLCDLLQATAPEEMS